MRGLIFYKKIVFLWTMVDKISKMFERKGVGFRHLRKTMKLGIGMSCLYGNKILKMSSF